MGPAIIIPVIILAVGIPVGFSWARKRFKEAVSDPGTAEVAAPGHRLTSAALRDLPSPPWRVVYEVAEDKLGGIEHVLIGPAGAFAVQTSMEPLPEPPTDASEAPDAHAVARIAIARGGLDDALARCAMSADRLVRVHWGAPAEGALTALDVMPGFTVVDGRALAEWAASLPQTLTAAQVDLAWQTVTTAIGRPDPLG